MRLTHPITIGVGLRHATSALPATAAALGPAALIAPLGTAVTSFIATLPAADQCDQYDARAQYNQTVRALIAADCH